MGRIGLAISMFFRILGNGALAEQVRALARGEALRLPTSEPAAAPVADKPAARTSRPPARSEALTLLAALQREGRFIDFVQEPIASYSDAQIGAAARDVHQGCAAVIGRAFALKAVVEQEEGAEMALEPGFDAARFHLVGNVTGQPPHRGSLTHHGWEATRCELPAWTGGNAAANVVAPAEVELK